MHVEEYFGAILGDSVPDCLRFCFTASIFAVVAVRESSICWGEIAKTCDEVAIEVYSVIVIFKIAVFSLVAVHVNYWHEQYVISF